MNDDCDDEDRAHDGSLNIDALLLVIADHPSLLEDVPDMVALAQTLARAIDDDDGVGYCSECRRGGLTASLAATYHKVLLSLHETYSGDEDGADGLERDLSTAVGDSPKG